MIFISPADFSINFLKPIDLENKLYLVPKRSIMATIKTTTVKGD